MRVPPVSERMKEAPAHALRAVFAGIGQVLLVADRIKNRATDTNHAPSAAAPEPAAAASETAAAAPAECRTRRRPPRPPAATPADCRIRRRARQCHGRSRRHARHCCARRHGRHGRIRRACGR